MLRKLHLIVRTYYVLSTVLGGSDDSNWHW